MDIPYPRHAAGSSLPMYLYVSSLVSYWEHYMDKIKKAVEEFQKENGNNNYPLKELVIYLVKRVDDLPCERHARTIYSNKGILVVLSAVTVGIAVKLFCF